MKTRTESLLPALVLFCVSFVAQAQRDTSITARFVERPPFPPGSGVVVEATITNLGTEVLTFEHVGFSSVFTAPQFFIDFEFVRSSCEPVIACSYRYCRNSAFPPLFPRQSNVCSWTFRVRPDALNQTSAVRLRAGLGDSTPENDFVDLVAIVGPKPPPEPINALSFPALFPLLLAVAAIGGFKLLPR